MNFQDIFVRYVNASQKTEDGQERSVFTTKLFLGASQEQTAGAF